MITRNKIMRIEKKCGSLVPSLILVVILSLSIHLLFILNVTNILSLFIWMIPSPIRTGGPAAGIGFNSGSPERRPFFHQPVDQLSDVRNPVIFNFGDSISDTGGSTAGFGLMYGFPEGRIFFHESTGRLCDGRLLIDFLCVQGSREPRTRAKGYLTTRGSESLNTSYLTPYLESLAPNFTNGANFAVSASSLLPRTAGFSLHSQLRQFHRFQIRSKKLVAKGVKSLVREKDFKKALYIIDIGMNDLAAAFHHLSLGHVTYGYVMNDKFPALISEIKVAILNIFQHGGKNFWVYNSGPLGCLPQELAASKKGSEFDQYGCLLRFNQFIKAYNDKLSALCEELRSEMKEVTIVYVDVYTAKYELFANFTRYGFENPFMACCGYGGPPYNYDRTVKCGQSGYNVCKDGSKYISWDGAHFTEAANAIVAAKILTTKYSTPQVRFDFFLDI